MQNALHVGMGADWAKGASFTLSGTFDFRTACGTTEAYQTLHVAHPPKKWEDLHTLLRQTDQFSETQFH